MKERGTWEKEMTGIDNHIACARAEDLVSYLYGEADEAAALAFEQHAQHCASCRTELAEFRQVRVSIGEWLALFANCVS
jgi:anti-sigma factor RsiW